MKSDTIVSEISYDLDLPQQRVRSVYSEKLFKMKKGGHFTIESSSRSDASIRNSIYAALRSLKKDKPDRIFIVRKIGDGKFLIGRVV